VKSGEMAIIISTKPGQLRKAAGTRGACVRISARPAAKLLPYSASFMPASLFEVMIKSNDLLDPSSQNFGISEIAGVEG
jgi:hypothetical protein